MPSGAPLDGLILHFQCSVREPEMLALFRQVAELLSTDSRPFRFAQSRKQSPLKDSVLIKEEQWEAEGARIEVQISLADSESRETASYSIQYRLILQSGFRLEIGGEHEEPYLEEIIAKLHYVRPDEFDAVHRLFRKKLGERADRTDDVWAATLNAQAALESGYGAFARHLIDQAWKRRPTPEVPELPTGDWWPRFRELTRKIRSEGPKGPEDAAD